MGIRLHKRDNWCYDVVVSKKGKKKKLGSINRSAGSLSQISVNVRLQEVRNYIKLGAFVSSRVQRFLKYVL